MSSAQLIMNQIALFDNEKIEAQIRVYKIPRNLRFPDGYKVKCVLFEKDTGQLLLLLDNHAPFGYHLHSKLPVDKNFRLILNIRNYKEAISYFWTEVRKVLNEK